MNSIFYTEKDAGRLAFLWNNYLSQIVDAKPAYEEIIKYSTKGKHLLLASVYLCRSPSERIL